MLNHDFFPLVIFTRPSFVTGMISDSSVTNVCLFKNVGDISADDSVFIC